MNFIPVGKTMTCAPFNTAVQMPNVNVNFPEHFAYGSLFLNQTWIGQVFKWRTPLKDGQSSNGDSEAG